MRCKGHIHNESQQGRREPCNANLRNAAFKRGGDGEIEFETYICDNQGCSQYKILQRIPASMIKEEET